MGEGGITEGTARRYTTTIRNRGRREKKRLMDTKTYKALLSSNHAHKIRKEMREKWDRPDEPRR